MDAMDGLTIHTLTLSAGAVDRILQTAIDAGYTYGMGYWATLLSVDHDAVGITKVRLSDNDTGKLFVVDREALERGLLTALNAGYGRFVTNDIDGPYAEQLIQFACFGELVYG